MKHVNTKNNSAPKTTRHTGREIGLELRKTHFILGNHDSNFCSQYRNDFFNQKDNKSSQNINYQNPNLRKNNMVLGTYSGNFVTSSMAQNLDLDSRRKDFKMVHLDENLKNELRTSHFRLGNSDPNFQTVSQSHFYPKSGGIENKLNSAHVTPNKLMGHKMGNDKVEYNSESHMKFTTPNQNYRNHSAQHGALTKINTQELQNSHYCFGKDPKSWATSSQISFQGVTPISNSNEKLVPHSNLKFGTEKTVYHSSQKTSHPVLQSTTYNRNRDAPTELRKHSIVFGKDINKNTISKNTEDYINPKTINPDASANKLDNNNLKQSHFNIGYPHQSPINQFQTTYETNMFYKTNPLPGLNNRFVTAKTNVKVVNDGKGTYTSDNKARFKYKVNEITQKEINEIKGILNDIRGHHWDNGSKKGFYTTTNNQFLQYDQQRARFSAIPLTEEHKNDLRYSHYELGKGNVPLVTTNVSTFMPNDNIQKTTYNSNLKKSSIEFNPKNSNLKNNTVYMSDFRLKETLE